MTVQINGSTGIDVIQDGIVTRTKTSGLTDLLQIVSFTTGAMATGTTQTPFDNTIPQNTEGDQYMSLTITPVSATSVLEIDVLINGQSTVSVVATLALFQDSTVNALAAAFDEVASAGARVQVGLKHMMTSGTILATTFKVRVGMNAANTFTFNGSASGQIYGGVMASRITIKEWLA